VEGREANAELEGLRSSATQVRDLVLGGPTGTSSLDALLPSVTELIEDRVDVAAANGVR
jgi:hypothetical protein